MAAGDGGNEAANVLREEKEDCEIRVAKALNSPTALVLLAAMRRAGCDVTAEPWRHFVCERCSPKVDGGFDASTNQVVICSNRCRSDQRVAEILHHEMVHLYDHCSVEVDFRNVRHLACTEVRAANLAQCKFSLTETRVGGRHADCVKAKAEQSVVVISGEDRAAAAAAVDNVFQRCYGDLEPIGRRAAEVASLTSRAGPTGCAAILLADWRATVGVGSSEKG